MEWVETTGKTIDEAKEAALDELGVDEQDAEFEVLAEPKVGLFGRLRTEGRVRARVRPTTPRAKEDRRDRRRRNRSTASADDAPSEALSDPPASALAVDPPPRSGPGGRRNGSKSPASGSTAGDALVPNATAPAPANPDGGGQPARSRSRRRGSGNQNATTIADGDAPSAEATAERAPRTRRPARTQPETTAPSQGHVAPRDHEAVTEGVDMDVALEEQGEVATAFLSGLVERFGLSATIDVQQPDNDTLNIGLSGGDLGLLIGPKGATLLSIQELTRTAVQRQTGAGNGRIYVDVSGYRQKRGEALARFTTKVAAEVQASHQRIALEPMSAPDRKVVHDTASAIAGVTTLSEGEEPRRRVVILPAED